MARGPYIVYFPALSGPPEADASLTALREAVARRIANENSRLIAEFTETTRGRRPQLLRALAAAQTEGATLMIARFDRLARNLAGLRQLIAGEVEVAALENPKINRRALPLIASLAESERQTASQATRLALAQAKAQGRRLGAQGAIQARVNKVAAYERIAPLAGTIGGLLGEGLSIRAMAARLNETNTPSPGGGGWHPSNLHRALKRLAPERFGKSRMPRG